MLVILCSILLELKYTDINVTLASYLVDEIGHFKSINEIEEFYFSKCFVVTS